MNKQLEHRLDDSAAKPLRALAVTFALLALAVAPAITLAADAPAAAPTLAPMRGMAGMAPHVAEPAGEKVTAKVLETMNAANYTYVRVKTASGDLWAAGPHAELKVGDTVSFERGVPMTNFASKSLNRTFESIDFVGRLVVGDGKADAAAPAPGAAAPADLAPTHAGVSKTAPAVAVDLSGIAKAKDGKTVAEVFDGRAALAGKEVAVRGKVVKYNPSVMGHNWVHVRDGSKGKDGSDDLTLTTDDTTKVGDTVVVRGKVATDKDFGSGYRYDVILEEAKVTVE